MKKSGKNRIFILLLWFNIVLMFCNVIQETELVGWMSFSDFLVFLNQTQWCNQWYNFKSVQNTNDSQKNEKKKKK